VCDVWSGYFVNSLFSRIFSIFSLFATVSDLMTETTWGLKSEWPQWCADGLQVIIIYIRIVISFNADTCDSDSDRTVKLDKSVTCSNFLQQNEVMYCIGCYGFVLLASSQLLTQLLLYWMFSETILLLLLICNGVLVFFSTSFCIPVYCVMCVF